MIKHESIPSIVPDLWVITLLFLYYPDDAVGLPASAMWPQGLLSENQ
jgi:hypothetical protein